jgi:hypothetical protein
MQSISALTDTNDSLAFHTRYAFSNLQDYIDRVHHQEEAPKALAICLYKRAPGIPFELMQQIGSWIKRIDKAIDAELASSACIQVAYLIPTMGLTS